MTLKINFCGDSFCASKSKYAWCNILSDKLNAKIIGLGKAGTAHEYAIKCFNPDADITIFCWSEPNRIYHKKYSLNYHTVSDNLKEKNPNKIYKAAKVYYLYIHNSDYAQTRQYRDLYWFDHEILSQYNGKIIHFYCFPSDQSKYYRRPQHANTILSLNPNLFKIKLGLKDAATIDNYEFIHGKKSVELSQLAPVHHLDINKEFIINHFTKEGNKKVAKYTYKLLQSC